VVICPRSNDGEAVPIVLHLYTLPSPVGGTADDVASWNAMRDGSGVLGREFLG